MTGRRRGRTGRGWDAAPARSGADDSAEASGGSRSGVRAGYGSGARSGSGASRGPGEPPPPLAPAERAREICLRLLSFRPRTRAELTTALRNKGIDDEVAAEVLDRYGEVGIIDDEAFAKAWVTSRHHGRGLARKALASELRRKGVDTEAVSEALDGLDGDTEAQTARTLVDRKLRSDHGDRPEAVFRRLVGMLARKGYPAGLAVRVVKEAIAHRADVVALEAAELIGGTGMDLFDPDLLEAEALESEPPF